MGPNFELLKNQKGHAYGFLKGIIQKLMFALTLMVISFYLFALMKLLSYFQVPKKYEKKQNI